MTIALGLRWAITDAIGTEERRMAWTWRYRNELGQAVEAPDVEGFDEAHPSQADAESWLGEHWRELLAGGVSEVALVEDDRTEYTMPLSEA